MPDEVPAQITNFQLLCLSRTAAAFVDECQKSVSSKSNNFIAHDINRMEIQVAFFQKAFDVYRTLPVLDMPHYSPHPLDVSSMPERVELKNGRMMTWCDYWRALYSEMLQSDSNSIANGFHLHDANRVQPVLDQMTDFITMVRADPTIDLPDQQQDVDTSGQPT